MLRHLENAARCGLLVVLFGSCQGWVGDETGDLFAMKSPVEPAYESIEAPLGATALATCNPAVSCDDCNVDQRVGHVVFVHGYISDKDAFVEYHDWLKDQNQCAGYKTLRVSIGQKAERDGSNRPVEISCTANEYDPACIGHCTARNGSGVCLDYDRTKNGVCDSGGKCVRYHSDGADKHLSVWAEDLASFFWNNKLTDLPDRSVLVVAHSTGSPAVAEFMAKGYDGDAHFAIPSAKVKRVITIQAALGGACGVSAAANFDDATSDLNDLQDDRINYDFQKATFDGAVPWLHVQSKGDTGLWGDECEGGGWWGITTGDYCDGTSHDGVTNNWVDSTSARHPNGAGENAGTYPYGITVQTPEQYYCHSDDDDWTSYRKDYGRFRSLFGAEPVHIDQVRNPAMFQAWWMVLFRARK